MSEGPSDIVEHRPTRVVIVDDSRTIQTLLEQTISTRLGWDVVGIASSAEEGLHLVRTVHPDVVTIDLSMPGGDGFSMLRELADRTMLCKAVIASNFDVDLTLGKRVKALGAHMHFDKKTIVRQPEALCAKLRSAVAKTMLSAGEANRARSPLVPAAAAAAAASVSFPVPLDEQRRIELVAGLDLGNEAQDEQFDLITRHLSAMSEFPACLLTIIDRDTQWVKSAIGIPTGPMPRSLAFCNHTICGEGMFSVPNTALDARFAAHPLVVGEPGIRSYYGYPIEGRSGVKIGALCAVDLKPRHPGANFAANLKGLAEIASSIIARR